MKATEQLKNEHEAVKLMMKILDAACGNLKAGNKPHIADFEDMIDFLKVFVDRCHHGKEEQILFPQMEKAGVSKENGPIGVMLAEHEQGRGYIRGMSQAIADYKSGKTDATQLLFENVALYIELLDQHIFKENNVLFAMADKLFSEEIQNQLFDRFEELEEKVIGMGKHEELHRRLEKLSAAYLV
jgi:hemerythrin-like domain-containing protein